MAYEHFSIDERDCLQVMLLQKISVSIIARILGRHKSSIYREINRNKNTQTYISHIADSKAKNRRSASYKSRSNFNALLVIEIINRIRLYHSPEQIAGRLKLDYPDNPNMHISYESIYKLVYFLIHTTHPELKKYLRQGKKKRQKRSCSKKKRGIIPNRVSIDKRPAIVDKKIIVGHWEGDTVEGKNKKGYLGTYTDKCSKFLVAFPAKNKTAQLIADKTIKAFSQLPKKVRLSCTFDNGKEFTNHQKISKETEMSIYFARPYHSWERGLNEHTNGLLRQFFPKKSSFENITQEELDKVVNLINNRPRKSLNFRTPKEVFLQAIVALKT